MGTKLCFYRAINGVVTPQEIPRQLNGINDVAAKDGWSYDILEADGEERFRAVVQEVIEGCNDLSRAGYHH
jgi:hypothetical protein